MSGETPDPAGQRAELPSVGQALRRAGLLMVPVIALLAVYGWWMLGPNALSVNGYIALTLGVLFTLALGVGLMTLVFYSNRYGYDAQVGNNPEDEGKR